MDVGLSHDGPSNCFFHKGNLTKNEKIMCLLHWDTLKVYIFIVVLAHVVLKYNARKLEKIAWCKG